MAKNGCFEPINPPREHLGVGTYTEVLRPERDYSHENIPYNQESRF